MLKSLRAITFGGNFLHSIGNWLPDLRNDPSFDALVTLHVFRPECPMCTHRTLRLRRRLRGVPAGVSGHFVSLPSFWFSFCSNAIPWHSWTCMLIPMLSISLLFTGSSRSRRAKAPVHRGRRQNPPRNQSDRRRLHHFQYNDDRMFMFTQGQ